MTPDISCQAAKVHPQTGMCSQGGEGDNESKLDERGVDQS